MWLLCPDPHLTSVPLSQGHSHFLDRPPGNALLNLCYACFWPQPLQGTVGLAEAKGFSPSFESCGLAFLELLAGPSHLCSCLWGVARSPGRARDCCISHTPFLLLCSWPQNLQLEYRKGLGGPQPLHFSEGDLAQATSGHTGWVGSSQNRLDHSLVFIGNTPTL